MINKKVIAFRKWYVMCLSRGWANFISCYCFITGCDDLLKACDEQRTLLTYDSVSFTEIHKWNKKLLQCKFGFKISEPEIDLSVGSVLRTCHYVTQ